MRLKEGAKINRVNKTEMNMRDVVTIHTSFNHYRQIFKVDAIDLFFWTRKTKLVRTLSPTYTITQKAGRGKQEHLKRLSTEPHHLTELI